MCVHIGAMVVYSRDDGEEPYLRPVTIVIPSPTPTAGQSCDLARRLNLMGPVVAAARHLVAHSIKPAVAYVCIIYEVT